VRYVAAVGVLGIVGLLALAAAGGTAAITGILNAPEMGQAVGGLQQSFASAGASSELAELDTAIRSWEFSLQSANIMNGVMVAEFSAKASTSAHEAYMSVTLSPGSCGMNIRFTLHEPTSGGPKNRTVNVCLPVEGEGVSKTDFTNPDFWKAFRSVVDQAKQDGLISARMVGLIKAAVNALGYAF